MGEALLLRSRKNPFRTKLKGDFEINWGMDKKEGVLLERAKREVELFDLKKFVSEEKRKKMMDDNANGNPMDGMPNPFGGMMGSNPFGGFNPSPMPNPNPTSNPFKQNPMADIDIDKVMADIDKKLKELEEEDEKEKQQTNAIENKAEKVNLDKESKDEKPLFEVPKNIKEEPSKNSDVQNNIQKNDKPKINVDVDSVIVNDNIITDDEFFDDFFQD